MTETHYLQRRHLYTVILLVVVLGVMILLYKKMTSNNDTTLDASHAATAFFKLTATRLPPSATNIQFYQWRPSPDLDFYAAYLKFSVTEAEYMAWITEAKLLSAQASDGGSAYLPGSWALEPGLTLPWWDTDNNTPQNAAGRSLGENGWMIAKYESGTVYLIATDSGQAEGSPGPY